MTIPEEFLESFSALFGVTKDQSVEALRALCTKFEVQRTIHETTFFDVCLRPEHDWAEDAVRAAIQKMPKMSLKTPK